MRFSYTPPNPLTEKLQRGLFEEEANRNLDAAIKEYQAVVTQSDEQRKVIATALFRLGECYRKLGKTNEAAAFYQRLVRDFSEQEQLAKLAGDNLKPAAGVPGNQSDYVRELQRRIASLRVDSNLARTEAGHLAGISPERAGQWPWHILLEAWFVKCAASLRTWARVRWRSPRSIIAPRWRLHARCPVRPHGGARLRRADTTRTRNRGASTASISGEARRQRDARFARLAVLEMRFDGVSPHRFTGKTCGRFRGASR